MSDENPHLDFLLARTVSEKYRCLCHEPALQSDAPQNGPFRALMNTPLTPEALDMVEWNERIRMALKDLVDDPDHTRLHGEILELDRLGVHLSVALSPVELIYLISVDVAQATHRWRLADRLHRGANRFLGLALSWIRTLESDPRFPTDEGAEAIRRLVAEIGQEIEPIEGVAPLTASFQTLGDEPARVSYTRACAQVLRSQGESLAAAALLAGVAHGLPQDAHPLRWELFRRASQPLAEHNGRDLSRVLLIKAGVQARYEEGGSHHAVMIENLDSAIGECLALGEELTLSDDVDFQDLCAGLHLDRAVWRLTASEYGHWLAIEDYRASRVYQEQAISQLEGERRRMQLRVLAHLLSMTDVAKEKAAVYSDQERIAELGRIVEIAEETEDHGILMQALERRSSLLVGQQTKAATAQAIADLERALAIEGDRFGASPGLLSTLGCVLMTTGTDYRRSCELLEASIAAYLQEMEEDSPPSYQSILNVARNWSSIAVARLMDPDESAARALDAYERASELCERELRRHDEDDVRHMLAKVLTQAGPTYLFSDTSAGWQSGVDACTRAIELLSPRYIEERGRCSTEWCDDLASAHFNRTIMWKHRGETYRAEWEADVQAAIAIRLEQLESFGAAPPLQAFKRLGQTILERSRFSMTRRLPADEARSMLEDCDRVEALMRRVDADHREEADYLRQLFDICVYRTRALDALERDGDALAASRRALDVLERLPDDGWTHSRRYDFELEHAKLLIAAGDCEAAIAALSGSANARRAQFLGSFARSGKVANIERSQELAALGAWCLCELDRPGEALSFLEDNRGYLFRDAILADAQALAARTQLDSLSASKIARAAQHLDTLQLRLSDDEFNDALRQQVFEAADSLSELITPMGSLAPTLELEQITALAPPDGLLLLPATSTLGTCIFLIHRNTDERSLVHVRLRSLTSERLEGWVSDLREAEFELVTQEDASRARASFNAFLVSLSEQLWGELIQPVMRAAEENGIGSESAPWTFVSHGFFDAIPLHVASYVDGGRRRHLIEDRVLRYAPGLSALQLMASSERRPAARLVGFINPCGDLFGTEQLEWPAIARLDWPEEPRALVGPGEATRDAFLELAGDPTLTHLHLGTHGEFNPGDPEQSGLRLSDGALLSVLDVLKMPRAPNLQLVCMSACQSVVSSAQHGGDEFVGLASSFIEAGARSVLGALYVVDDERAAPIVAEIYRHMLAGKVDVAEALRRAVCDLLAASNRSNESLVDWASYKPIAAA